MVAWITVIHQIGSASAAYLGGLLRIAFGTYLEDPRNQFACCGQALSLSMIQALAILLKLAALSALGAVARFRGPPLWSQRRLYARKKKAGERAQAPAHFLEGPRLSARYRRIILDQTFPYVTPPCSQSGSTLRSAAAIGRQAWSAHVRTRHTHAVPPLPRRWGRGRARGHRGSTLL